MSNMKGSRNDDRVRSRLDTTSNDNMMVNNSGNKRNRQNLVLSTSFVSTQKLANAPISPKSPLQARRPRTSVSKALLALRNEINELQQQLVQARKGKENAERIRDSATSGIYKGAYSTDHLHKHSMRIRANSQIRDMDKVIRKLERQITDLKQQHEQSKRYKELGKLPDKLQVNHGSLENLGRQQSSSSVSTFGNGDTAVSKIDHVADEDDEEDEEDEEDEDQGIDFRHAHKNDEARSPASSSARISSAASTAFNASHIETATWLVSDYMQSLQDTSLSSGLVLKKANGLVSLLKEQPEIRKNLVLHSFMPSMQALLLSGDKIIAAAAYRVCRYLVTDAQFVEWLFQLHFDAFIVVSLAKDNVYHVEREQALKFVRAFIDINARIPKEILQAVISCIEKQDDRLKHAALETLLELCFIAPDVVNDCQGMRVLEAVMRDYSHFPVASIILDTVLKLMSSTSTRQYVLKDFNISVLITVFSDTNTKASNQVERMRNASLLLAKALKDYNGLMLFSMDNFKPLKALLSFFQIPFCAQYLIDVFLDVLRIKKIFHKDPKGSFDLVPSQFVEESMLVNQHTALLVLILHHSGFVEQVMKLIDRNEESDIRTMLISKVRYLLSEFLNLAMSLLGMNVSFANEVVPPSKAALYEEAFEFCKMSRNVNKSRNTLGMAGIDYHENVKNFSQNIKGSTMGRKVDDFKFRKMVYDSKVLQTKDFSKWNWNLILELVEGPLHNVKQLDELARSTKFIRRLLVFYRPLRMRFSAINKGTRQSQKYVEVGCHFFRMLTATEVGMKILMDDTKIISQLASLLYRAMEGHTSGNIINSNTLDTKLISGYFKFIGVLTQSFNGIMVLKRWNFFTVFYKMFECDSPLSLRFLELTLPELGLKYSGHCKTIIGKALVIANEDIRVKATENLAGKLKEVSDSNNQDSRNFGIMHDKKSLQRYVIDMLTRQLYDLSPKVVATADQALYDCIMAEECTQETISSLRTSLKQMVFIRSPLLFELLGTPYGFQLLNSIDFIEAERRSWLESKNREFVSYIEGFLATDNPAPSTYASHRDHQIKRLPQHFYGSLAKTEDGIALISKGGDLLSFVNTIKKYASDTDAQKPENEDQAMEVKSALWCTGYIGSTKLGIGLLDNFEIVKEIIKISYQASETTMRFTAFFALGLMSRTQEGCEILDEMGWCCCLNVQGNPMGITYPKRLDKFLSFNEIPWSMQGNYKEEMIEFDAMHGDLVGEVEPINFNLDLLLTEKDMIDNPLNDDNMEEPTVNAESVLLQEQAYRTKQLHIGEEDRVLSEILEAVSQLGNHILSNNAIKEITDMNHRYGPKLFESEVVFFKIMEMMAQFRFKPHVRKFLCGLFINEKALENVIKHDRKRP